MKTNTLSLRELKHSIKESIMSENENDIEKMPYVIIDTKRAGYSPDQVTNTLTVNELMTMLEDFDPDALIMTQHDNGYMFGGITNVFEHEVSSDDDDDDDDYD